MKKIVLGLSLACLFASGSLFAATEQQNKMATCNKDAAGKKGDERKKFMSSCLKDKQKAQQERMKSCNKDAGDKKLKGDERKGFMKDCLSTKK